MRAVLSAFLRQVRRSHWERDMDEELRSHIEARAADLERQGISAADAARRARVEFGGIESLKERCREASWAARVADECSRNLRLAVRSLIKRPGFTAVGVISLALGIGANLAIFNLVERLLLTTLAVRDPEGLYQTGSIQPDGQFRNWASYVHFDGLRRNTDIFEGTLAWSQWTREVEANGFNEKMLVAFVSGSYFPLLGVQAHIGRAFTDEDDRPGVANIAVIGHSAWQKYFNGSGDVLGKNVQINKVPFEIVGVAPPGFTGTVPGEPLDVVIPLHGNLNFNKNAITSEGMMWLNTMVRLKPNLPLEAAKSIYRERSLESGKAMRTKLGRLDKPNPPTIVPAARGYSALRNELSRALLVLMGLVAAVLLIGCANLSTLLFVRSAGCIGEMSLRLALGASRGQLIWQWMTESLLVALAGGVAGLVLARWIVDLLLVFVQEESRQALQFQTTPKMAIIAVMLTLFTSLLFGILPALRASKASPGVMLKESQRSVLGGRKHLARAVLAFQIAASLALVTGAALFVRTLSKLNADSGGVARSEIVYAHVRFPRDAPPPDGFLDDVADRLKQSQVVAAASTGRLPMLGGAGWSWATVPGYIPTATEDNIVYLSSVAPGYFRAAGTEILAGRDFEEKDRVWPNKVTIVSESFVRHYFGGRNPIGEKVRVSHDPRFVEIVGVARDIKYRGLREPISDVSYTPAVRSRGGTIIARPAHAGNQAAAIQEVRSAVMAASKNAIIETGTLEDVIQRSLRRDRLVTQLSAALGVLGLFLAAIGLYGVMAHEVASRAREIGIRMALGASSWGIIRTTLREAALVTGLGVLVGFPASVALAYLAESLLYDVAPSDPLAFAAAALILSFSALIAAFWPARQASRLDPVQTLRCD